MISACFVHPHLRNQEVLVGFFVQNQHRIFSKSEKEQFQHLLIAATVMLTLVWKMCLLCKAVNMQVYVPECSWLSGLLSRRDPSPSRTKSWSSSAWPSHWFVVCLVLLSYLKMSVGSLEEEKVQVREKLWSICGALQGMSTGCPSSCVTSSETKCRTWLSLTFTHLTL